MQTDTIETLYPKLAGTSKDPSYLEVDGNDVTLHIRVIFDGDADKVAASAFGESKEGQEAALEMAVLSSLPEEYTFKDVIMDAIPRRWDGAYEGNEYDFFPGMTVNFNVDITEQEEDASFKRYIKVTVKDDVCGVCHQAGVNWKANCSRHVTMYTSDCRDEEHKDKPENDCAEYASSLYSLPVYQGTVAHEFGHVFGLKDMYAEASVNHGYEPVSAKEIEYDNEYFGLPKAGEIMKRNGKALSNDIEMVLEAFQDNSWQYFVPHGRWQKISAAIIQSQVYLNKDDGKKYVWDFEAYKFVEMKE